MPDKKSIFVDFKISLDELTVHMPSGFHVCFVSYFSLPCCDINFHLLLVPTDVSGKIC